MKQKTHVIFFLINEPVAIKYFITQQKVTIEV